MRFLNALFCAVAVVSLAHAKDESAVIAKLEKLRPGMKRRDVVAVLGDPSIFSSAKNGKDSSYYRLAVLPGAGKPSVSDSTMIMANDVRCDFDNGVLVHVAGYWPKQDRPPTGTPKEKVMLVDSAGIFDNLALTKRYNASLQQQKDNADAWIQTANLDAAKLVEAYTAIKKEVGRSKVGTPERTSAELKAKELLEQITAKQDEIKTYSAKATKDLGRALLKYRTARLPQISDAVLSYQKAHGYTYLYEIKNNIFSPAKKPMFVAGVDVTEDAIKWIDDGGGKEFGIPAAGETEVAR